MIFIVVFLFSFPVFAQLGQQILLNKAAHMIGYAAEDLHSTRCNPADNFTAAVGGIGSCARFGQTTTADLKCWDRRSPVNFTREFEQTDKLEEMSAGFFYQELAMNSKKQAECRSKIILSFFKDPVRRNKMVQKAGTRFSAMKNELHALFQYKKQLDTEYRLAPALARANKTPPSVWQPRVQELAKKLEEIAQTITKMIISMPMGYDTDVAKAIAKMGEAGKFDAGKYAQAVVAAKKKYDKTIDYFNRHTLRGGHGTNFCIDRDFRKAAQTSGQTDAWLNSMPAGNKGERLLRDRLKCRLDATYGKGPARITAAVTVAGIATSLFPLTAVPGMALRGVAAAQAAVKLVSAVNSVSLVMQAENTRRACFGEDFLVSGSRRQCDVNGEFEHYMNETGASGCAINTSLLVSYVPLKIPMHIVRYVRRAVSVSGAASNQAK